jgi:hypothetical protein
LLALGNGILSGVGCRVLSRNLKSKISNFRSQISDRESPAEQSETGTPKVGNEVAIETQKSKLENPSPNHSHSIVAGGLELMS